MEEKMKLDLNDLEHVSGGEENGQHYIYTMSDDIEGENNVEVFNDLMALLREYKASGEKNRLSSWLIHKLVVDAQSRYKYVIRDGAMLSFIQKYWDQA